MQPATQTQPARGAEKILVALAEFEYLTAEQITRLLYAPSSLSHVRKQLRSLVAGGFVFALGGKAVHLHLLYTLSGVGRTYAVALGASPRKRFRKGEAQEKGHNPYFLKHTIAVIDVLISARLLANALANIELTRIITEQELKRKIYVDIPEKICIEPDASLEFLLTETWHEKPQTWKDFIHIEVYRNLPPQEWRFKQKIQGYVTYAASGQHEALFNTSALSLAVIAAPDRQATLKRWTEETLKQMDRTEEGDWFFFCSLDPAKATPEELFLSPVWENAFGTAKTPLLMLAEESK
jgi:protein involved in plasmid replication-relaxation